MLCYSRTEFSATRTNVNKKQDLIITINTNVVGLSHILGFQIKYGPQKLGWPTKNIKPSLGSDGLAIINCS